MKEVVDGLRGMLAVPGFATSLPAQVRFCDQLAQLRAALPVPVWEELVFKAASLIGIPPERLVAVCALSSIQDKRRALRIRHGAVPERTDTFPRTGWLGAYLDTYANASVSEVPVAYHFWTAMVVLAASLRRNVYMDRGAYFLYPNQYAILVGPSGAHKTGAYERGILLLEDLNEQLARNNPGSDPPVIHFPPKKLTPEALLDTMNNTNPAAALIGCDELSVLLGKNVKGSDRMVHLLTDAYGCQSRMETQTRTHGLRTMRNLYFNCIFGSTPEWLSQSITHDMVSGGFTARCLFIYRDHAANNEPEPEPNDPIVRAALAAMLTAWTTAPIIEAKLTPEAREWFNAWYSRTRDRVRNGVIRSDLASYYARKPDHLLKLGMLLTVSQLCDPDLNLSGVDEMYLGVDTLRMAENLLLDEEAQMGEAFDRIGEHPDAANAAYILNQVRKDPGIQHSLLYNRIRGRIGGSQAFRRLVEDLEQANLVRTVRKVNGSRVTVYYWPTVETHD